MGTPNSVEMLQLQVWQLQDQVNEAWEQRASEGTILHVVLDILRPVLKEITTPHDFLNERQDEVQIAALRLEQRRTDEVVVRYGVKLLPGFCDLWLRRDGKFFIAYSTSPWSSSVAVVFENTGELLDWADIFSTISIVGALVQAMDDTIARREAFLEGLRSRRARLRGMFEAAQAYERRKEGTR